MKNSLEELSKKVKLHPLFKECSSEGMVELGVCAAKFLNSDCGVFESEEEVLGFMEKSINDRLRHGVYETSSCGRVHVLGTSDKVLVLPDLVFCQISEGRTHSINTYENPLELPTLTNKSTE